MQGKRVGHWIELGFWQLAVRLLSSARPLRGPISRAASYLHDHPLPRRVPVDGLIALAGWGCGLVLGYWLAQVYF